MTLLLDTHAWLWWTIGSSKLSKKGRAAIADSKNRVVFSAASAWEIAIKYRLGKLPLPMPPNTYIPSRLNAQGFDRLDVTVAHAVAVADLPAHHQDPFDRLLIAQALLEGFTLLTTDRQIKPYAVGQIFV